MERCGGDDGPRKARAATAANAVLRFDGQLSTFKPHDRGPCYRCLYPEPPKADDVWSCEQAGILGSVAGVMGSLQATEVLKEILNIGYGMAGRLLIYDAKDLTTRMVKVKPDPKCVLCSDNSMLTDVGQHPGNAAA